MVMAGGMSKVDQCAALLRVSIIDKHFVMHPRLPCETDLMSYCKVSRVTVRAALTRLHAEGLVESVPGVGWRSLDAERRTFETVERVFDLLEIPARPALIARLLELRADHVAGAVAAMLRERAKVSPAARKSLEVLRDTLRYAPLVLECENHFLDQLTQFSISTPRQRAASQIWRAIERVRFWLEFDEYLPSFIEAADELVAAVDAHQPTAVEAAHQLASAHDHVYLRRAHERVASFQSGNAAQE
jgi:DNA-binding FadR family transcriptional regulator